MKLTKFILTSVVIMIFILPFLLRAQEIHILTYEDAIKIALNRSYTVKSYQNEREAMEQSFNYFKAQFKPMLDFSLNVPSWSEKVSPVYRAEGLPVYNSNGSLETGGNLRFTYILPSGGNLSLFGQMYRQNLKTVLALENYRQLTTSQATTSISLNFEQPIFTRNRLDENLDRAKYMYEKAQNQFTRGQMDIIYNVTQSFYDVYRATREVEIAREKLKNSQEAYRVAKLKAESGRIPEGDVLISEITVAQNRTNLSRSEGDLASRKDNFKQLIGLPLTDDIQIQTDLQYEIYEIDLDKAINEALENRLEIKESEYDIKLQKIEVDRAKRVREFSGNITAYYDLTGVSTLGGGPTRDLVESSIENFQDRPPNRGITLTFSYPIMDWGRCSARMQEERARLKNDKLALENLKTRIIREVRDVVRSVEEAKNRLEIQEKNQKTAQKSYRISEMRFENGDITSQELGREQERLAETQLQYLDAFINYQLAISDLKRKTLWDFKNNQSYLKEDYFKEEGQIE